MTEESPRDSVEATLSIITHELDGSGFAFKPGLKLTRRFGAGRALAELAATNEHFTKVLESVRRGGKPAAYSNAFEPIAWAAVESGLI